MPPTTVSGDLVDTVVIRDVADGRLLLRIGPPPEFTFEWGEAASPDEAACLFAESVEKYLHGAWLREPWLGS